MKIINKAAEIQTLQRGKMQGGISSGTSSWMYAVINVLMIGLTAVLFFYTFFSVFPGRMTAGSQKYLLTFCTVIIVHVIKAIRLYLAFYGEKLPFAKHVKTYCKVTPVSMVIPFKLGELFRMFCYGAVISDMPKGVIVILLDRFADTAALVAILFFIQILYGGGISGLTFLLVVFLLILVFIYAAFPSLERVWTEYLLHAEASEGSLTVLTILKKGRNIYDGVSGIMKGRGSILFLLSLAAWFVELGNVWISGIEKHEDMGNEATNYLMAALGQGMTEEMRLFTIVSIITLLTVYVCMKGYECLSVKQENDNEVITR